MEDHVRSRMRTLSFAIVALAVVLCAPVARGVPIDALTRMEGYGATELSGIGLVVGLNGTGDGNEHLPLARKLAAYMSERGTHVGLPEELADGNSVAIVHVSLDVPEEGAKRGDTFDVRISTMHSAGSLAGGRLISTPLSGPLPGQGVYAFASGDVEVSETSPTSGRVVQGGYISESINMGSIVSPDGSFVLNLRPQYAGMANAEQIAEMINQDRASLVGEAATPPASVIDARSVRVEIPDAEMKEPTNFIAHVQSIELDQTLLNNTPRIRINKDNGTIAVSGTVTIEPTVLSHKGMTITITEPPPEPGTPENPRVEQRDWAKLSTGDDESAEARLEDLVRALEKLDVPAEERVDIVITLHNGGFIHGTLEVE